MKYNIGDIVRMNGPWVNKYGIILGVDDREEYPPVYQVLIQGNDKLVWVTMTYILREE